MKGKSKNMVEIREVIYRLRNNQSDRLIGRETGVDRAIVGKLRKLACSQHWLDTFRAMPTDDEIAKVYTKKKHSTAEHSLDAHCGQLKDWRKNGRTAVVMQQLLKGQSDCSLSTIRRYINKHFPTPIEPVMVRIAEVGKYMDIDFGYLGIFLDGDGRPRKAWVFSFRLRYSRKAYREVVLHQDAATFLICHVHAFEWFGGCTKYVCLDNTKAAIIQSTIDNDMIRKSYQELAEHYSFLISPCQPRTPEHKGGVESDIKYIKKNFLAYFLESQKSMHNATPKLYDLITALAKWDKEIANLHIVHGVGSCPKEIFDNEERQALLPLPPQRWDLRAWTQHNVRKEWRIMHLCAYYSVPYQYIGKDVQVCTTSKFVRIFCEHREIALHEKAINKWEYKRNPEHAPLLQEAVLQCNREGLLSMAENVGPFTRRLVEAILDHPCIDKLKTGRRLLHLGVKHSPQRLEKACQRALEYKLHSYSNVKNILENGLEQQQSLDSPNTQPKDSPSLANPQKNFRFARDSKIYNIWDDELLHENPKAYWKEVMTSHITEEDKLATEESKKVLAEMYKQCNTVEALNELSAKSRIK